MEPEPHLSAPAAPIRRRRVFFLHGLDPRGAKIYHALYREQADLQGRVTGQRLTVGESEFVERVVTRWTVEDAAGTRCDIDALRWDDLIRQQWRRSDLRLLWEYVCAYAVAVSLGSCRDILKLSRNYWFSMTYPLAAAAVVLLLPPGLALSTWAVTAHLGPWIAVPVALAVCCASLFALRRLGSLIKADWIMQITVFTKRQGEGGVAGLEERVDLFAERVRAALSDAALDEVLVVGHSAGAALAVSTVARVLGASGAVDRRLGLLTLGHMIPTIGLNPPAARFRDELARVAANAELTWIDVTAPPDGACFALSDPVTGCGLAATGRPQLVPARFHRQFTPARYRQVRRNRFRLHMQYLMAAELPEGFDYFRATAGQRPLAELCGA